MLADPSVVRNGIKTYRRSSWDRSGRNADFLTLQPGATVTLLDEQGPGRITHFYWATIDAARFHYRQLVLRAWWDGEAEPSIESPIGDFFCVPHCQPVEFSSAGAAIYPGADSGVTYGHSFFLPMPFRESARIELTYETIPDTAADTIRFWYHLHLEQYTTPPDANTGRLHAQWRRENPTNVAPQVDLSQPGQNVNLDGRENYIAVEAKGHGQLVGVHLQIDNVSGGWYGEGDDMVFIDGLPGEQWPPAYPGTGTEEVFGGGGGPSQAYSGLYQGFHLVENRDYSGKNAMYRWYLADPICFERSLVWTIEHGHANNLANDYASLVYWYQYEPHYSFPALPSAMHRLPRQPAAALRAEDARARARQNLDACREAGMERQLRRKLSELYSTGCKALLQGRNEEAQATFDVLCIVRVS
jgi:D-arabinan exo alpha-(1,3)/(1,5)-arabinofuranosidase (non-reducing end)